MKLAFDIGWDFARFGRRMGPTVGEADIRAGYIAGREHFRVPQHTPDRFVSKWLQLRANAYRRRRILNPEVTPEYLKRIDCPMCPITLVRLTHSTLSGNDWSVDRINNDGAYAAGNLMVMSTSANRAKGAKTYDEVARIAAEPMQAATRGLTAREWARVACVMVGAENSENIAASLGPLLTRIPEDSRVPLYFLLQHVLIGAVRDSSMRHQIVKSLCRLHTSKTRNVAIDVAADRLSRLVKHADYDYDALSDGNVQHLLRGWFTTLPRSSLHGLLQFCAPNGATRIEPTVPSQWSLRTQGRF